MMELRSLLRRVMKAIRLVGHPVQRHGLRHGTAAAIEALPLLRGREVRGVIDVGANRGQFSLVVLRCFPDARIRAFEPLAEAAAVYERVFAGRNSVTLHRVAVAEAAGAADLHVSGRPDCSSLLPIGREQERAAPGSAEVGRVTVPTVALDDVVELRDLPRPVLLKIDVQGTELAVLRGAERCLDALVDLVLVEASFVALYDGQVLADEIVSFLDARGFGLAGVGQPWYGPDGRCLQADLMFRRRT